MKTGSIFVIEPFRGDEQKGTSRFVSHQWFLYLLGIVIQGVHGIVFQVIQPFVINHQSFDRFMFAHIGLAIATEQKFTIFA